MDIKRGAIVQSKNHIGKDDKLFLILKVDYDKNQLVALKLQINKKINDNFVLEIEDRNNSLFIKYAPLSILDFEHIEKYDHDLLEPYDVVNEAYDIREKNMELIKKEQRRILREKRKLKSEKKRQINMLIKKTSKTITKKKTKNYPHKMAGVHDPIYKGYIKIVRG